MKRTLKRTLALALLILLAVSLLACREINPQPQVTDYPQLTEQPPVTELPQITELPQFTDLPPVTDFPQDTDIPQTTHSAVAPMKPVIYLYPTTPTDVFVTLDYKGTLTCTYPAYNDGWRVTAYPDGKLINRADGFEYSYLYWEGRGAADFDFSRGFVIAGSDTAAFLREKLAYMGLTPREYNEFIVYWLPQMQDNAYNLITFQSEAYTSIARLNIVPPPDSLLRVFMVFKPLAAPIEIEPQELTPFERIGFTAIEWGGAEQD